MGPHPFPIIALWFFWVLLLCLPLPDGLLTTISSFTTTRLHCAATAAARNLRWCPRRLSHLTKLVHLLPSELSILHVHVVAVLLPGLLSSGLFPSQPLCLGTLSCVSSPRVPSLCPSAPPRFAFDNFPHALVSRGAMTCTPEFLLSIQIPPNSRAICTIASELGRAPLPPTFLCTPHSSLSLRSSDALHPSLGRLRFSATGQPRPFPKLFDPISLWRFSPNSFRLPHAASISHDDLRRRRFDTQVDAILTHARQFPEAVLLLAFFSTSFLQQMPCLALLLICPSVSSTRSSRLVQPRTSPTEIPRVLRSRAKWNASHQSSVPTVLRCRCESS